VPEPDDKDTVSNSKIDLIICFFFFCSHLSLPSFPQNEVIQLEEAPKKKRRRVSAKPEPIAMIDGKQ
jgi:hypothetical protein